MERHAPAPDRPCAETMSRLATPKPTLDPDFFTPPEMMMAFDSDFFPPLVTMTLPPEETDEPEDQLLYEPRKPLLGRIRI